MDFETVKDLVENYFNGQYEVIKFLGAGSFAEVYLVNHKFLDDLRAMKIIKEPLSSVSESKKVFDEVRLATDLRHENIIAIHDAGVISTFGQDSEGKFNIRPVEGSKKDNWAYFMMEYVQGGDLEQYLSSFINSNIPMPIARVLDIIKQILQGLNTLHSSKPPIVHRDLKPNNILLSFNSKGEIVIKISDFGFAREVSTSTIDVEVAGNKNYMAPECFKKVFSTKTDVYAIGVIFYQILANHCPYNINRYSLLEVLDNKPWSNTLKAPSHYRSEIPKYLDDVVVKALSINPANRYLDAQEFLADVERCIEKYDKEIRQNPSFEVDDEEDVYSEYIMNDSIKEAFRLAKCENKLADAIEILEHEILADYDIRKCYSAILRVWKSKSPDIKLISQAFTVNLKGNNYKLSINLLKEAIAYNPSIKNKYYPYIELWDIFSDLRKYGNLIKAVLGLEDLMNANKEINKEYSNVINTLKTYSASEILNEALRLADLNSLVDASKLMEFAVVADKRIRAQYAYKLSLLKQNMKMDLSPQTDDLKNNTVDYAIDLGTTDSIIAYFNNGNPIVVKNHITGEDFTPSAVLIDESENIQVGENAKDAIIEKSEDAVSEFKYNMGFSIPYKFDKSSQVMLPEELSAEVLKDLRVSVYEQYGENLEHVVITVPANSNPMKTKAVNDAAELAGFRSHNLILEPIAVAIAYGLKDLENNAKWMIYDLGGATFNVSLIKNNNGEIQKRDTAGLDNHGGNLFDLKIVEKLFVPKIRNDLKLDDFEYDNSRYSKEFSKLKKAAEKAKKELSLANETEIYIKNLFDGYDFRYLLTHDEFKDLIEDSVKYTLKMCRDLISRNELADEDISKIILAGGSSLSPIVQELISEEFDIALESGIDPLTVVAKGGAIYAGSLEKPTFKEYEGKFSIIVKSCEKGVAGRVFAMDKKFSFLGYNLEFVNLESNSSTGKVPLTIDGAFKMDLPDSKEYTVNIYDKKGNSVEIDEKSPSSLKVNEDSFDIYIEFFKRTFNIPFKQNVDSDELMANYKDLSNQYDYLKENYAFDNDDFLDYLHRMISSDRSSTGQIKIYTDYLTGILDDVQKELDLEILVENIENKVNVILDNDYFEIDDIVSDFDLAIENKDLNQLNKIYSQLIERYVTFNRDDVIEACFFNLRFEGIFTQNQATADELIKKGLQAVNDSDFIQLFGIVSHLYKIDERT